jgi:hypothetical protein
MEISVLQSKIYQIRGFKVMLDFDLASLYDVETRVLKQSVRRNIYRFPKDFMFQLSKFEWTQLITNCDNLPQSAKFSPQTPFAFTEQGVAMLSSVLKSMKAIEMNIAIMRAFVEMRNMLSFQSEFSIQISEIKKELELRLGEQDAQIIEIYQVLEKLLDKKEEEKSWKERPKIGFK